MANYFFLRWIAGGPSSMRRFVTVGMGLCLCLFAGCREKTELAQVTGQLTLDGRPLESVQVEFIPSTTDKQPRPISFATTDSEGRFRLTNGEGRPGVLVGEHIVVLHDVQLPAGGRLAGRVDTELYGSPASSAPLTLTPARLPKSYTDPAKTPLQKTVRPGEQVINLELLSTP